MSNEEEHFPAGTVLALDGLEIARIIFDTCRTSEERAFEAARLIVDYLGEVFEFSGATRHSSDPRQ